MELEMRPLVAADEELLYRWRCDESVVENSISRKPPTREEHRRWMLARMFAPRVKVLVAELDGVPVATCTWFCASAITLELAYMVAEPMRGMSVAKQFVGDLLDMAGQDRHNVKLFIREANAASRAVAKANGFVESPVVDGFVTCRVPT